MAKKIIWLLISCLIVLSLVLVSCGEAEEEEEEEATIPPEEEEEAVIPPEEEEEVVVPPGANWWDYHGEPQYGGILTWRLVSDIPSFDPWRSIDWSGITSVYGEGYFMMGWTQDRETCPFAGGYTPLNCYDPLIIEGWEINNWQEYTFHLRKGIHWHDKPPVNGRELTAYDLEYALHRLSGLGSGFTSPTPHAFLKTYADMESITATDKYTLVVKCKFQSAGTGTSFVVMWFWPAIQAREVVEQYGNLEDWRNAVGTGPFILTDYVSGSSVTYIKNTNYWGYDQRHPENKLPYVEGVKLLIIPDNSTAYAALRTGKIVMIPGVSWEQADQFAQTNPEIKQAGFPDRGYMVAMRTDTTPFTDINVRKALNMAVDHKTIAMTYYGGRVEGKPYGYQGPAAGPYYTPFEDWPKDLQEGHSYNPDGARKLLADAGYPDGLQTSIITSSVYDVDLLQIVRGYFLDIGVDMEIKIMEPTVFNSYINVVPHKHDQLVWTIGSGAPSPGYYTSFSSKELRTNIYHIDDPVLDELVDRVAFYGYDDMEKIAATREIDMHAMNLYLTVNMVPMVNYTLYQPWLKGYSGESVRSANSALFARWWIDQDLKKAMGH